MTKRKLSLDFETFCEADIRRTGSYRYILDDSFEILLCAFAFDDEPVRVLDFHVPEDKAFFDEHFGKWLDDDSIQWAAYNAAFELTVLAKYFHKEIDYDYVSRFRCTMIRALYCGFPGSLANAGAAIGLPQDKRKMAIGTQLINRFSRPQKPTKSQPDRVRCYPEDEPEKWELFKQYCRQDVETEREIARKLAPFDPPAREWALWALDIVANWRGVGVDMDLVRGAIALNNRNTGRLMEEAKRITGLENPNSVQQLIAWLNGKGVKWQTIRKADVVDILTEGNVPDDVRRVLEIRQQLCKTSCKKYDAIVDAVWRDSRVRGIMQFYGASRTGRWAGRLIQLQNLPQNHLDDLDGARVMVKNGDDEMLRLMYGDSLPDTLSQLIRTALVPRKGCVYATADFSAIEARVISWLAGEEWVLDVFRNGGDIYCQTASQMFGVPVEKHGVNGHLRQKGKIAQLACIAEGQLVLTDHGEKPIETVALNDRVWDGENWVEHEGVVYRGIREVMTYEGLTATPDHIVYTTHSVVPMKLVTASANNYGLDSSGPRPNKRVNDYQFRMTKTYDVKNAGPNHRYTVSGVLVHNCGYGGAKGAMINMGALRMGLKEDELPDIVDRWRKANPHITALWAKCDNALQTVMKGVPVDIGKGVRMALDTRVESGLNFMTISLPSGRKLYYSEPHFAPARNFPDRMTFHYMGQNQVTRKWEATDTFGGKIVENCLSGETLVATDSGLKHLKDITEDDYLWDGNYWVSHEGLIDKGVQMAIFVDGLLMTPEHKILTTEGWCEGGKSDGLDWEAVQLPYGYKKGRDGRWHWKAALALQMRLRERDHKSEPRCDEKGACNEVMRVHAAKAYKRKEPDARNDASPSLRGVARNESAVLRANASCLEELRGKRYYRLRALAAQLRELLGGYGPDMAEGLGSRQDQQRKGLQPRKLPMDNTKNQFTKQAEQPLRGNAKRSEDSFGTERDERDRHYDAAVQTGSRMADRISVDKTEFQERVYDIRNCGPWNRFTVYDPSTQRFRLVHNCVQSIARDILCDVILKLYKKGFIPVFSVHDEVIVEVPEERKEEGLKMVLDIMSQTPKWVQGDLPLKGAGFIASFYQKD